MVKDTNNQISSEITRPPVVVILGHVDHGKTSILDAIRSSKVAAKEAGGITQHVGAYQAQHNERVITFLDTPGHEAFTAIRSRGAKTADIAILVVAADEGVKPQTKEAIRIILESKIEFIVAINKIDKEAANPMRVRQELAENEVLVEGYGGSTPVIELSAKTGKGLDELLDMIILMADLQELKANTKDTATGVIIETQKEAQRGQRATILVQNGRVKVGDVIVSETSYCKIKSIEDFLGKSISEVLPSQPCVVYGWEGIPPVGGNFESVEDVKLAEKKILAASTFGNKTLFTFENSPSSLNQKKTANLIIKADAFSSLEAIEHVLKAINSEEVTYRVIHYGVGNIGTADIQKAQTTNSTVIGFNIAIEDSAKSIADREHINTFTCQIIYELAEKVREVMSELLDPETKRTNFGKIKVLALFKSEGKSQIIGGKVTQGKAVRGSMVDVFRNSSTPIMTGKLGQLQHNKQDVTEVAEGQELGLRFDQIKIEQPKDKILIIRTNYQSIQVGDTLEIYSEEKIKRSL